MSDDGHAFSGSRPEFYQRYIVPMLFRPHERILAARGVNLTDGRVLEIAPGTGAMTRTLGHGTRVAGASHRRLDRRPER
jgi:16S rRNA A1518/A1519 N6-dimethyltransferase RsmA/KsgA/DIM1 with predicted DNA glycosylase/AP lyase activity